VTNFFTSFAAGAEILQRRPDLRPGNGFGEFVIEQQDAFVDGDAAAQVNSPLALQSLRTDEVAEQIEMIAGTLAEDDPDRDALNEFAAAVTAIGEWGPKTDKITVDTAERPIDVVLIGEESDIQALKDELGTAGTIDELTEIALRHQSEVAQRCGWPHTDTTPCCSRGGHVAPESSPLHGTDLAPLAICHDFERPSDEAPAAFGMTIEDLMRMFGAGPESDEPGNEG
jgi:hypothetical protein